MNMRRLRTEITRNKHSKFMTYKPKNGAEAGHVSISTDMMSRYRRFLKTVKDNKRRDNEIAEKMTMEKSANIQIYRHE